MDRLELVVETMTERSLSALRIAEIGKTKNKPIITIISDSDEEEDGNIIRKKKKDGKKDKKKKGGDDNDA